MLSRNPNGSHLFTYRTASCTQANHLLTHVILVRVACGSNIQAYGSYALAAARFAASLHAVRQQMYTRCQLPLDLLQLSQRLPRNNLEHPWTTGVSQIPVCLIALPIYQNTDPFDRTPAFAYQSSH